MARLFFAAILAALTAGVAAQATAVQTPPGQDPAPARQVFRAGANFVAVDAYPTQRGRIVDDLTREDFQVYEDGKLQQVEQFEFVRGLPDGAGALAEPVRFEAAERLVADPRRRVFVVFLTGYRVTPEGGANTRTATTAFFAQSVAPSDLFGILRPNERVADMLLGERPEILGEEAASYSDWAMLPHPPGFARSAAEQDVYECLFAHQGAGDVEALMNFWREDKMLTELEELVVRLASMREARSNVLLFTGKLSLGNLSNRRQSVVTLLPGMSGAQPADTACEREYQRLLHASPGDRLRGIVETAIRRDVSITVVDPAGLSVYDQSMSATQGRLPSQSIGQFNSLQNIASATGGASVVGAAEIGPALIKFAGEQSGHYELGYYSSNNKFDGKFRSIDVKVKRSGVSVIARKGYQAPTAEMLRASEIAAARAGTDAPPPSPAAFAVAELGRLNPDAGLYTQAARRAGSVAIVAEIATTQIEQGRWKDGASIDVRLLGAQGQEVAAAEGSIPPGAQAVVVDVPIAGPAGGALAAAVRAVGATGELVDRIDVPSSEQRLLGDPLVFGAGTTRNAVRHPTAGFVLRRTEQIHVEWPVLAPLDRRGVRLLNPSGQLVNANASVIETTDAGLTTLAADVSLAPLAPGAYVVEVTVGGGAASETRLVAFTVVR